VIAANDTLPTLLILRHQCRLAYCALHAAKQRWNADVVKIVEFLSECGRAKCFFSQSSKPRNELSVLQ